MRYDDFRFQPQDDVKFALDVSKFGFVKDTNFVLRKVQDTPVCSEYGDPPYNVRRTLSAVAKFSRHREQMKDFIAGVCDKVSQHCSVICFNKFHVFW